MRVSYVVEFREVLHPSILTIPCHMFMCKETTRDHHCVCDGVRDGARIPVIKWWDKPNNYLTCCLLCPIFKPEAWLLGTVRFDQNCCFPSKPSHEVGATTIYGGPGDKTIPIRIQSKVKILPGARVWCPLHAGRVRCKLSSSAQEATISSNVLGSLCR